MLKKGHVQYRTYRWPIIVQEDYNNLYFCIEKYYIYQLNSFGCEFSQTNNDFNALVEATVLHVAQLQLVVVPVSIDGRNYVHG